MRQVQVTGCLPAALMLLLLGGLVALLISASLAVVLPVAAALLLLALARSLWFRLTGRRPPPFQGFSVRGGAVGPAWREAARRGPADDEGPVVDALPRPPRENPPAGG